jgi:hypothetical protein
VLAHCARCRAQLVIHSTVMVPSPLSKAPRPSGIPTMRHG